MQSSEQAIEQPRRQSYGFKPGQSGNPAGRESKTAREARITGIIAEWTAPYGGVAMFNAAEHALLQQAVELSLRRTRAWHDQVKVARTVSKLLMQLGIATGRKREIAEPGPSLADYVAQRYPADGEGAT
jgi:hypothetical protein